MWPRCGHVALPRSPGAGLSSLWAFLQRSLEQNRFGRLSVRCSYEVAEQRLAVEVLHAADLLPLDANGEGQTYGAAGGRAGWHEGGSLLTALPPRPE